MPKFKHQTREGWLIAATKELKPLFKKHKAPIPARTMVSCGWPRGGKTEFIGQCFGKSWTSDGTTHIFICPTQADPIDVLAILVHELVHAAVGVEEGHRGRFKKVARSLGLEGKLTATTVSEKSPLYSELKAIAKKLGKYPHSKMAKQAKGKKFDPNKWIRMCSRTDDTYRILISPKSLKEYGSPLDFNGEHMIYWDTKHKIRKAAREILERIDATNS